MKKFIILIGLLCTTSSSMFSQESNLKFVDGEFYIDVDESVFVINQDNSYFTKTESSAMQFNLMPRSYDDLKKRMMESQKEGYKKEIEIDSIKMILVKTTQVNDDGEFTIAIYCKKINNDFTLVLNSFYKTDEELIMKPLIEKAMLSAKLKE
tara:strand:- start:192 stop:647 length:456 start_codon:yes stop_codon:yes gene_type:complete